MNERGRAMYKYAEEKAAEDKASNVKDKIDGIIQERHNDHGNYVDQFTTCAKLWSCYLQEYEIGSNLSQHDVAVMNILQKISRIKNGDPSHGDHWDDIGGYAKLGKLLAAKK